MNKRKQLHELKALVTAGSTWTKIDDVRIVANIFTGNTGIAIARHFANMGIETTLLYNPKINAVFPEPELRKVQYVTYQDLRDRMKEEIEGGWYDIVIHSAAVSDYGEAVSQLVEVDQNVLEVALPEGMRVFKEVTDLPGKIKSDLPEMVLCMTKTGKIVDEIKKWDPNIFLVKFKLEVGRSYEDLLAVAEKSRLASSADLIVANDLHGSRSGIPPAIILGSDEPKTVEKRKLLPSAILNTSYWELGKRG